MPLRILCLGLLAVLVSAAGLRAGEPADDAGPAVALRTREGSLLLGILSSSELVFEKDDGGAERLAWKDVKTVVLAERIDAKDAEAARKAVAELASENYQTRQKAQQRLEALGRGASPALRAGAGSKDPEVAIRARELLVKLGVANGGASGDRVTDATGQPREGTVTADRYELRTARGTIVLPAESVSGLTVLDAKAAAALRAEAKRWPASGERKVVGLVPVRDKLEVFTIFDSASEERLPQMASFVARGARTETIAFNASDGKEGEMKEGDVLDEAFLSRGLRLDGLGTKEKIVARRFPVAGENRFCASVAGGGMELRLEKDGCPLGAFGMTVVVGPNDISGLVFEAYDAAGRLLARKTRDGDDKEKEAGFGVFLIDSAVPVHRLNVKWQGEADADPLCVDMIMFSHPLAFDHDTRLDALTLAGGERFVGKLETVGEGKDRIAIRPAFLPKDAPSIIVDVKDLARIVPALAQAAPQAQKDDAAEPLDVDAAPAEEPRVRPFIPHGILLQNGDRLMARLVKLDSESAVLELPGRVELKLPRAALRKVDLRPGMPVAPPPAAGEGEGAGAAGKKEGDTKAEAALPADPLDPEHVKKEKTGVEFVQRTASAAGKTSTEGMPRMDNAEVLAIDLHKNALTVDPKDGGPPWPIDLHSARFLVFPETAAPPAGNAGGWELTLRIGSRFAFELQGLDANGVRGRLAGGEVTMPWSAIESVEQKRSEGKGK